MALNVIIKNTFLDVDEPDELGSPCDSSRRSLSVPCAWRPGFSLDRGNSSNYFHRADSCGTVPSTRSTAASDDDLSDGQDFPTTPPNLQKAASSEMTGTPTQASLSPETTPTQAGSTPETTPVQAGLNPKAAEFQMPPEIQMPPVLPVFEAPTMRLPPVVARQRHALNPEARAFEPNMPIPIQRGSAGLPAEISTVVAAAKHALLNSPHVVDVKVAEGGLGLTTSLVAEVRHTAGPFGARETLALAKASLLGAAARSQMTYVLGYFGVPFQDHGDSGFRAMIGSIPLAMQDTICWDTYQKGFCPRRSLCRWCHPMESDLAPVHVILKRSGAGLERPGLE